MNLWGFPVRVVDNPLTRLLGFYLMKGSSIIMEREQARQVIKESRDLIATHSANTESDEFEDAFDAIAPGLAIAVLTLLLNIDAAVNDDGSQVPG